MSRPLLVLTPGDPAGIGPEITLAALRARSKSKVLKSARLVIVGASEPFEKIARRSKLRLNEIPAVTPTTATELRAMLAAIDRASKPGEVAIISAPTPSDTATLREGFQSGWSIETAFRLVSGTQALNQAAALVTGPISKERLRKGGYLFNGHTDFLAALCGSPQPASQSTMMLANSSLRVSLVTTHLPLKAVSSALTIENISRTIIETALGLRQVWNIRRPKIAVTALNPHAGENGLFGDEEITTIAPAIDHARKLLSSRGASGIQIDGPFPSDTLFALPARGARTFRHDAVVCMYHDQGLIPVKLLDFPNTVNITLGLPILRTSVDHGTAFDIAGKGIADPSSLIAALKLAASAATRYVV